MTKAYRAEDDKEVDSDANLAAFRANNTERSLDDKMTVLELAVGAALWNRGLVKIPRSKLTKLALDLAPMTTNNVHCRRSNMTFGDFYGNVDARIVSAELQDDVPETVQDIIRNHRGYSGLAG